MFNHISPERLTTPQGFDAAWFHDPQATDVSLRIIVWTGSFDDPDGQEGRAHFYEHLPFRGTAEFPDTLAVAGAIESVGGFLNAMTGNTRTKYWVEVPAEHVLLGWRVVSDLVFRPRLDATMIDAERAVVTAEIAKNRQDYPHEVTDYIRRRLLGGELGAKSFILGTPDSLDHIGPEEMSHHRQRHYQPENMSFIAGGNLDGLGRPWPLFLDKHVPAGGKVFASRKTYHPGRVTADHWEARVKKVASYEVAVTGTIGDLPGDLATQAATLSVMATILWRGGMTARLFEELRLKRELVYMISGSLEELDTNLGIWEISTITRNEADARTALELIRQVVHDPETWSAQRVAAAQRKILGKAALQTWSGARYVGWMADDLEAYRRTFSEAEWLTGIQAVHPDTVREFAARLFAPERLVTIIHHP